MFQQRRKLVDYVTNIIEHITGTMISDYNHKSYLFDCRYHYQGRRFSKAI